MTYKKPQNANTLNTLLNLKGKNALIVGGAGLLGGEISYTLAELGAQIFIASRNEKKSNLFIKNLQSKYPGRHKYFFLDISNKNSIIEYAERINNTYKEIREYLISVNNLLDHQKKEMANISEKIVFIEREINRLGNIKGSENILNIAINMVRQGNSKEQIIDKTGLREDEVEAIYTYYKK